MNQEQYYLNQDLTSECIQLPNLFQGECLLKENYLSELSDNPQRALQNLGIDSLLTEYSTQITNIIEQLSHIQDFEVQDGHSVNMNELLTKGIYRNCSLGRPQKSANGEYYTCVVIPINQNFKVCSGITIGLSGTPQGTFKDVDIENIRFKEFYSNNDTLDENTYLASINTQQAGATVLLSVAPSRANKGRYGIYGADDYPALGIGYGDIPGPIMRFAPKYKIEGENRWNYEREINKLSLADLRTFELQLPNSGFYGINIASDSSRYYNWWVFDVRPACGYTPILQVCFSQTRGRAFYRMLYTKDNTKFVFPFTLYSDWKGSATEINSIYLDIEGLLNDIDDINNQLEIINNFDFKGLDIVYTSDPIEFITPSSETMDKIYLRLWDYGFNPDGSPKMETYNGYVTRKEVVGSPGNENTVYKWVQISQCLTSDEIQELINNNENNYILKNNPNTNQGTIDINCDSFELSSSVTFTDDSEFIKYNGKTILSSGNDGTHIYSPNDLYHDYEDGSAIIYDSRNFNLDTLKIYKSNAGTNDIIKNDTSFKNAVLSLEEAIMNLPSNPGECQCELPEWVTDDEPEFGEENKIDDIKLNLTSLTPDNTKTVTIQIGEGLTVDNSTIKHDTNSEFEGPVNEEKLYKIKFDKFGHITGVDEVDADDLLNILQSKLDDLYAPNINRTPTTSITISPNSLSLTDLNPTGQLSTTSDGTNNNVSWTSSNANIATVNSNGLVTGKSTGNATITATLNNSSLESGTITDTITILVTISEKTRYIGKNSNADYITTNNYSSMLNLTEIPSDTLINLNDEYLYIISSCSISVLGQSNNNINMLTLNNSNKYTLSSTNINNYYIYRSAGKLTGTVTINDSCVA